MKIERCSIKSFRDVEQLNKIMQNQIKHYGQFTVSFEFPEKQPEKPKKNLYQKIEERTPYLPFKEAKQGFRTLVHDIGSYYKNMKIKDPKHLIVRTLSTAQIILVILTLVGCVWLAGWILSNLLW